MSIKNTVRLPSLLSLTLAMREETGERERENTVLVCIKVMCLVFVCVRNKSIIHTHTGTESKGKETNIL